MLSRAVLRSVRTTALRPAPIGIVSNLWMRGYAKDHKSKQRKPLTFGGQPASNVSGGNHEPAQSSTPSSIKPSSSSPRNDTECSKQQPEFQTSASPEDNTAPQSTSPSAIDPAKAKEQEKQKEAQEEEIKKKEAQEQEIQEEEEQKQQQQALPDLRQGLPSTIDRELRNAASKGKGARISIANLTEDPDADGGMGGSYVSSADRRKQKWMAWSVAFAFGSILLSPFYLGRNWESEEEEKAHPDAPSGFNVKHFFLRIKSRINGFTGYYTEPAFTKLLPDITDAAYGREYTLVLNLEDLLIHNEWSREKGWRLAKRPGLDYFLRYLQQYYELVIWTTQPFNTAEMVLTKLDPYHLCQPLFREATVYYNGEHIKDLSYLNRDPSKVIVLETNPASIQRQRENAIIVKKFEGDPRDKELVSLIPFLEYIPAMQTKDVREIIKVFEGTHVPTEFAKREAIQRKKHEARLVEERKKHPKSGTSRFANLLGIKPQLQYEGEITFAEALAQGKMIQDIYRERGQREYEKFNHMVETEGPKWLAEEAAMQKTMQEEMMKMNPLAKLGFQPPPPPPPSSGSGGSSPAK